MTWALLAVLLLVAPVQALTSVSAQHPDQPSIDLEFERLYEGAQDQQFTIATATQGAVDLKEGQFVIYASTRGEAPISQLRVGTMTYIQRWELYK